MQLSFQKLYIFQIMQEYSFKIYTILHCYLLYGTQPDISINVQAVLFNTMKVKDDQPDFNNNDPLTKLFNGFRRLRI